MASRIQGITVEIGGDTTKLQNALKGVNGQIKSKEQFHNEKMYQSTMIIARKLLEQGAMTRNEYDEIDTIFTEKYHPTLGTLFCDLGLIYIGSRANM